MNPQEKFNQQKFNQDRKAAFDEIQTAIGDKIRELALWSQEYIKANPRPNGLLLPEHVELSETFRWPAQISHAAGDLKAGKKSLREVFAAVSSRYETKPARGAPSIPDDFNRSAAAMNDGRQSAFEDMHKLLDIAERDFDISYKPLNRNMLDYWHKKHPIGHGHLEFAHRENQRHYMRESLQDMRRFLHNLQAGQPVTGVSPKRPSAPKP